MPDEHEADQPPVDIAYELSGGVMRRWVVVRHATVWRPPTDVYEQDDRLIVVVEIAGMHHSEIQVTLQGQRLIVSGVRQRHAARDCAFHQLEIPYGEFRTEVSLPWPVARDQVTASYRDGFLRIELPHAPAQKIQIVSLDENDSSERDAANDDTSAEDGDL
ncbi:MAG: Hsp20/alpha crystallin family protein [Aggregatilineaceae bacterium]